MEAKLFLRRRERLHLRLPTNRSSIGLSAVRERVQHRVREMCCAVWKWLKTRDPQLDFWFTPHSPKNSTGERELTRIFIAGRFAALIPGNSAAEYVIANGFLNFLNLYNYALIGRVLLTWFPSRPPALERPLSTICDPYLNLFRGIIPPLGGLDFSPILAFVVLNVFTNAAAALPAELPKRKPSDSES